MATVNKSDRKKQIATEIFGRTVVFQRVDTGEEITRIDTRALEQEVIDLLITYGTKQIVGDIVASLDGIDAKAAGMERAVSQLLAGTWPRRTSEVSIDKAAETLAASMGITVDALKAMLGQA